MYNPIALLRAEERRDSAWDQGNGEGYEFSNTSEPAPTAQPSSNQSVTPTSPTPQSMPLGVKIESATRTETYSDRTAAIESRLLSAPAVRRCVDTFVKWSDLLKATHQRLLPDLDPEGTAKAIEAEIAGSNGLRDAEKINNLRAKHPHYAGDLGQASKAAAQRAMHEAAGPGIQIAGVLLDTCDLELDRILAEAHNAEKRLFAEFGLPREDTGISKRVHAVRGKIREFQQSIAPSDRPLPALPVNPEMLSHVVSFFRRP